MGCVQPVQGMENRIVSGVVQVTDGEALLVRGDFGLVRCQRATGCLLTPVPQDRVLLAFVEETAWVLAVLERKAKGAAVLHLPEQAELWTDSLAIRARTTHLDAEELTLSSRTLRLAAEDMSLHSSLLALSGKVLVQGFGAVQNFACWLGERVFRRKARYGELRENVDGLVERQAGRVRLNSRASYRLRAENADIRAKTVLDLDAEHIKMG